MRKYLFLFMLLPALSGALRAQKNDASAAARTATDQLIAKYQLDEQQAADMYRVQERKQLQMAEIEPLKAASADQYRIRLKNVQKGALGSVKRILTTQAQQALFQKTQKEVRDKQAAQRKALAEKGASAADIEAAMLAIYIE